MKTLYIDCTNGVSGDMIRGALEGIAEELAAESGGHHGRSHEDVKRIIAGAAETAEKIYAVIAKAEASVHKATEQNVHFHEVGRNKAIENAMAIGMQLAAIAPDSIIVSKINDGHGYVDCAHGRIPVPVPAVRAMMENCGTVYPAFAFGECEDADTEMVTPSGLAAVIGIGAKPAGNENGGMMFMQGKIIASSEAEGTRTTGRGALRMYLIEK